jgi:hypothetical protein
VKRLAQPLPGASYSAAALTLSFCVALAVLAMVFVTIFWDGGTLEQETTSFVTHYTAARPLLPKVFDPHTNEADTYQARELSYFFDYLDAKFYTQLVVRLDPSFFIPATALAVALLIAVVFAVGTRRVAPNIDPLTAALILGFFCSNFVFLSTLSIFYRSGRPLLALLILAYLFHVRAVQLARSSSSRVAVPRVNGQAILALVLAIIAGLLDRQGVFYAAVACGVLFIHWLLTRQLADVLVATVIAVLSLQAYNFVLAPWLIHALNGYWPSFGFQQVPLKELPIEFVPALDLIFSNFVAMFGGFLPVTVVASLALLGMAISRRRELAAGSSARLPILARHRVAIYTLLIVAAHIVMFTIMIARHPPIYYQRDHHHWNYEFPAMAVLLFGLTLALNAMLRGSCIKARRAVQAVLLAIIIGNLFSLPRYSYVRLHGQYFSWGYEQSNRLKKFLLSGKADPELVPYFREFGELVRRQAREN